MLQNELWWVLTGLRLPSRSPLARLDQLGWQITSHIEHLTEGTLYRWRRSEKRQPGFTPAVREWRIDVVVPNYTQHMECGEEQACDRAVEFEIQTILRDQS